jgi:hypothetical protein
VEMAHPAMLSGEISQSSAFLIQDRLKSKFSQCVEPVAWCDPECAPLRVTIAWLPTFRVTGDATTPKQCIA